MGRNASGLYEANLTLAALGEYRVVVTEPPSANSGGTIDSVTLTVVAPKATAAALAQAATDITTQVGSVDTKLTGLSQAVSKLDGDLANLTGIATAIRTTTTDTNVLANQISMDTQALLTKWGTLDASALMNELATLSAQVGTVKTDMAKDATVAKAADLQAKYDALIQNLTALSTQVGDPAQKAALDVKLATIQSSLDAMPVGKVDVTAINTQLASLEGTLTSLRGEKGANVDTLLAQLATIQQAVEGRGLETTTLLGKLNDLEKLAKSAQDSAAAVGLAQGASHSAGEALAILQQLRDELKTAGASQTVPILLGKFGDKMQEVAKSVTVIPGELDTKALTKQLAEVTERIKAATTEKGYHFDELYEMAETQSGDVKTMRNRVEELKALLEVQRALLEQNMNQPVMKTWFEAR